MSPAREPNEGSGEYVDTAAFRGARFTGADLTGARFRDCDLTGVRIVASQVAGLRVSGFGGSTGTVVVDDVDVTEFVQAELDRRHPERVQLRQLESVADHAAMWDTLERLWSVTFAQAEQLPEPALQRRVDDEWSLVETLRHLVFADDVWVGRMLLDGSGYHRLGLPPTDYPRAQVPELGLALDARPSFREMRVLDAERRLRVRRVLEGLTDGDLGESRTGVPAPAWGQETYTIGTCLRVLMREHCEHRRFAVRDLAKLGSQ